MRLPWSAQVLLLSCCTCYLVSTVIGEEISGRLTLLDDQGLGDPANVGVTRMRAHGGYLYLGTWNTKHGGRLYRSRNGNEFQPIAQPGFGNPHSFTIQFIEPFQGRLYISTWNNKDGGAMYRANVDTDDAAQIKWETITTDGMGDRGNRAFTHLHTFKNHLYAGCFNLATGPELWRSPSGDPGSWTQVNQDSFGLPANSDATMMVVHDGYLYVGTETARALPVAAHRWRARAAVRHVATGQRQWLW